MSEVNKPSEAVAATPKRAEEIAWMEASIWTPHMVEALQNGVKGGPNSFFADKGLFSMTTAHIATSHPARR